MSRLLTFALTSLLVSTSGVGVAVAQECGLTNYLDALKGRESSFNPRAVNPSTGTFGLYQMSSQAMQDLGYASAASGGNSNIDWTGLNGINSYEDFFNNPQLQEQVYEEYANLNWGYIEHYNIDQYIGQTLPNGTTVTQSGLLMASQFGVGNLQNYFNSGMSCASASDASGVCVEEYMTIAEGYDVSSLIGRQSDVDGSTCSPMPQNQREEPWTGDTTSKTCSPTVAMLQATPCGSYPAELQGFCYRYKPLLMDNAMCQAAENWAENVPPSGPHLESCKTQTFRDGTSSWSYVHACAKAEPAMGAEGSSDQRVIGAGDDPACYQRLRSMGIDFVEQGMIDRSTGGVTCIIPNSLIYRGGAVDFGRELQMNCALAEQVEYFGQALRGKGVTGYSTIGTLDCRPKRNANGVIPGSVSLHGTGNALDIDGFYMNGGLMKTQEWFTNPASKVVLEDILSIACSIFDGTLAFSYYKGSYSHMHFQSTERTTCDGRGYY